MCACNSVADGGYKIAADNCWSECLCHDKQQRVTDLQQIIGIVSKASALGEKNRKCFLFAGPQSASSWTSARQPLQVAKSDFAVNTSKNSKCQMHKQQEGWCKVQKNWNWEDTCQSSRIQNQC